MGKLDGQVAIVTGGARGSGEAITRRFVSEGARVVIADVLDDRGQLTAEAVGEAAFYHHCDVSQEQDWEDLIAYTVSEVGPLNILVNNAAISRLRTIEETTLDMFLRIVNVNEVGPFLGIRSAITPMRDAGGGSIVNISSIAGHFVSPRIAGYAASKFAVRGLTKVAALELGRYRIRVNAICPSTGSSEMLQEALPPHLLEWLARRTADDDRGSGGRPLSRSVSMEDVAATALFLASEDSAGFTGADFMLDGGMTCGDVNMGGLPY
jgi:3alpha(or 20beta)-hydroxysteroid dehydrogenase